MATTAHKGAVSVKCGDTYLIDPSSRLYGNSGKTKRMPERSKFLRTPRNLFSRPAKSKRTLDTINGEGSFAARGSSTASRIT